MKTKQEFKNVETEWYTKPSDTGVLLNFRARCPGRYKRNIVEGLVHRIFSATSSWEAFTKGLDEAMLILERNQYPPVFYQPIIRTTLEKILGSSEGRCERKGEKLAKGSRLMFFMQYRGPISDRFSRKLRTIAECATIFTTRKLRTALPPLKCGVSKDLFSGVVYKIVCSGCDASYIGQTARHVKTRFAEHLHKDSPLSGHLETCRPGARLVGPEVLDKCGNESKLLTLEALYIQKYKPELNQREEYRQRELTLRL